MLSLLKATGKFGIVFVILALVVTLLKSVIAFVGFVTMAVKFGVILAFVLVIVGVGLVVLRGFNANRKSKE